MEKENAMNHVLEEFSKIGMIPVIAIEDAADAKPLAKALLDGGLPCAEVTFRTAAAEKSIRAMTEEFPDMLVGAGTVLTIEQAECALGAGAEFIVSPGFNPKVVAYCVEKGVPVVPGCANPSNLEQAIELGLETVKFFPAEASGGLAAIKAMSAPYRTLKFMPTGGIHNGNIKKYLDYDKVIACGGSWMVDHKMLKARDWDGIAALTRQSVNCMLGCKLCHVGINMQSDQDLAAAQERFASLFGTEAKEGKSSVFAGSYVEIMKSMGRGTCGHIAVGVNYVDRAVYHLRRRGFSFDEASKIYQDDGKLKSVYLADEIAGFAVHLIQNKESEGL